MKQKENSVKKMKSALNDLHGATARLLDVWHDLDDEISTDKESARFWFIVTDTYGESPFAHVDDSFEAVPTMMQNWIEAIEEMEKEA